MSVVTSIPSTLTLVDPPDYNTIATRPQERSRFSSQLATSSSRNTLCTMASSPQWVDRSASPSAAVYLNTLPVVVA